MQISNNNTNFRGGFLVSNIPASKKAAFLKAVTKDGTKVFEDFSKEGSHFVLTPDKNDANVLFYIKHLHTVFNYYPQIQPGMRNSNTAEGINKIIGRLVADDKTVKDILQTLEIKIKNPVLVPSQSTRGKKVIKNPENGDIIEISPQNTNKINYVRVTKGLSMSEDSGDKRYAVRNSRMLREFDSVSDIFKFRDKFNKTLILSEKDF